MQQEWLRVRRDVRALSGHPLSFFLGRDPQLVLSKFEKFWCHQQVLASVLHVGQPSQPRLLIRLSSDTA
jgi:hypothetical protein